MTLRTTLSILAVVAAGALSSGCKDKPLPPPDPKGKDLVTGAVVAAVTTAEKEPGVRTYKVIHVDEYPEPVGNMLHLTAYDPKTPTFEDAREVRLHGKMRVVMPHFEVRAFDFIQRDHRVIAVEPLTDEERQTYEKSRVNR